MRRSGIIVIRGIVQGVGFRPFVYAKAAAYGMKGYVKNLGSEVEVLAFGDRFEEFLDSVSKGTPLSRIDAIEVRDVEVPPPDAFTIRESGTGSLTGFIPPDVAICEECVRDIGTTGGHYETYWGTSCVNCGPRYSIIKELPYDRIRTSMDEFPTCEGCHREYTDPVSRRHHAQTIACQTCGPSLTLLERDGSEIHTSHPVREAASLLDSGYILGVRGIGGFHIACIEESARELKTRLGRSEQPFAVMVRHSYLGEIAVISDDEWKVLLSPARPIVVLKKRNPAAHRAISNLHTLGCMIPYTGLHHLLFSHLLHPLLIMTSANMPGYPMITEIETAKEKLKGDVDYFLTHNRSIVNRCDDSVVRDRFIIRLSRGFSPTRTHINLGCKCILGVGPELNANATLYKGGVCITSPHVGHVTNPPTLAYLQETIRKITGLLGARYDIIAHDLHPAFLSTRYAKELADEFHAELVAVQHHEAHIAAATQDPCVGIAIDGVGYGRDGTVWGGEIFTGIAPHFRRVAHLQYVPMPGGDLATRYPERMLYGILPGEEILGLLHTRGWEETALRVLKQQVARDFNSIPTSSTGRVLDAVAAMLGICRERTYDGEPAMRLESEAFLGDIDEWPVPINQAGEIEILATRALVRHAFEEFQDLQHLPESDYLSARAHIAASFQHNLARGIARLAINAAQREGYSRVALSGGVAYNEAIRTTIRKEIEGAKLEFIMNHEYPLGDGCISYGQCVMAGLLLKRQESM